jgi:hypothetical protein
MTGTMTLNTITNQAVPIELAKPTAGAGNSTIAPTETMVPAKNPSSDSKSDPNSEAKPEVKTDAKPEVEKTPDPENPWSQDSFINSPNKGEKLLIPHSALPQEFDRDGKPIVKTAALKEATIDAVESDSDEAQDRTISIPIAAVSPEVSGTSLEPMRKHYAESITHPNSIQVTANLEKIPSSAT